MNANSDYVEMYPDFDENAMDPLQGPGLNDVQGQVMWDLRSAWRRDEAWQQD